MNPESRRKLLRIASALVAARGIPGSWPAFAAPVAQRLLYQPEPGAHLKVLRWKRFVQGDDELWTRNTQKFTQATGVEVVVTSEGWEDIRPKTAVAATIGAGPDIILGWYDDPHQIADHLVDVSDIARDLAARHGGWYDICTRYGKQGERWIALPLAIIGNALVYRQSMVQAAGFKEIPGDLAGFLALCKALKARGTPAGFAMGNAVGDGNNWAHWLVWSHGARLVDANGKVVIDSPETLAALAYAKAIYATFIPGTASWQDPSNNKAFLDNQISLTANGISIYDAARNSPVASLREMAKDIRHAHFPVGAAGKPTELSQVTQMMLFKHSRYPNAARAYMQFMLEDAQYNAWISASNGYISQTLRAYAANPVWTSDPQREAYRDVALRLLDNGHAGPLGKASAAALADYIIVDMVAEAATGARTAQQATTRAAARARRYYPSPP